MRPRGRILMNAIILPLHGPLPTESQIFVFQPPSPNARRIIVTTNISERSLTIDGIVVQAIQRVGHVRITCPRKCY